MLNNSWYVFALKWTVWYFLFLPSLPLLSMYDIIRQKYIGTKVSVWCSCPRPACTTIYPIIYVHTYIYANSGQKMISEDCFKVSALRGNSVYWLVFWDFSRLILSFSALTHTKKKDQYEIFWYKDHSKMSPTKTSRESSLVSTESKHSGYWAGLSVLLRTWLSSCILERVSAAVTGRAFGTLCHGRHT